LPGGYPDLLEANPEPCGRRSGSPIGEPDPHAHTLGDQDVVRSFADLHAGEPNEVVTDGDVRHATRLPRFVLHPDLVRPSGPVANMRNRAVRKRASSESSATPASVGPPSP